MIELTKQNYQTSHILPFTYTIAIFNNFFLNFQNTVDITGLLVLVDSLNKVIKKLM